ncbi:MAG: hypothetical protein K0U52_10400 [Gammaproteobacteria bacterium]|jgi:hypothetical protein|nr:hypothetical protein [Gammaproteobacteria bacterium]
MKTESKDKMLKALEEFYGIVSTASQSVGISRQTHYRWLEDDQEYKAKVQDIKNSAIDFVETKLFDCIKSEKETSIIFYLKTIGKSRGYVPRQEIDTGDNKEFRIEVVE